MQKNNVVDGLFQIRNEQEIYFAHRVVIGKALDEFAGTAEQALVDEVIRSTIKYVSDLPASEYHHHANFGGLLEHMLDVSLLSIRMARGKPLRSDVYGTAKYESEKRWIFACWMAGLLHDIGKVFSDIEVFSDKGERWNPHTSDFLSWSADACDSGYRVAWSKSRFHNKHEQRNLLGVEKVIPSSVKEYLSAHNLGIYDALLDYFSGKGKAGYVSEVVKKADGRSIEVNTERFWRDTLGERTSPVEKRLIDGIRMLLGRWDVNDSDGRYFVVGGSVLLRYPECFDDLVSVMAKEKAAIPMDPFKLLSMLENIGWVEMPDDGAGCYLLKTPICPEQIDVVKMRFPAMLFDGMVMPDSVAGVLMTKEDSRIAVIDRLVGLTDASFDREVGSSVVDVSGGVSVEKPKDMGIKFEEDVWSEFCGVIKEKGYQIDGSFLIAAGNDVYVRWPDLSREMMMEKDEALEKMEEYIEGWIDKVEYQGSQISCVKLKGVWAQELLDYFGWSLKEKVVKAQKKRRKAGSSGFYGMSDSSGKKVRRKAKVSQVKSDTKVDRLISMTETEDDLLEFFEFLKKLKKSGRSKDDIVINESMHMVWLNVRGLVELFESESVPRKGLVKSLGRLSLKPQSRKGVSGYLFDSREIFGV